jgi:hypothetical protein
MSKKCRPSEQRELFNPQPSLLEEQEEEIDAKARRFLGMVRQARQWRWRRIEEKGEPPKES